MRSGGSLHRVEVGTAVGDVELNRQDCVAVRVDERIQGLELASRRSNLVSPFQGSFRPFPSEAL